MSEEPVQRRLAAVLAADVASYTRLMEEDSEGTVAAWRAARDGVIEPAIGAAMGRVVKLTGDGFLAEFPTVQDAVNCALQLQGGLASSALKFRIGVNLGDIIDDGRDIHGEGVNVAARIEALAEPGGICISGLVYESVRNRIQTDYRDMGEQSVKNVSAPVRVYALGDAAAPTPAAPPLETAGRPSIAVLPFDNLSGDAEQEYFSDGISEDIITDLSKISTLMVVARNSSFTYKGRAVDLRTVAKELGVAYVLEGSVRKAGGRVRITAQLIDGADGAHLWAERYDRELEDIFAVQDEVAKHIIEALQVTLTPAEEARLGGPGTDNIEAYDYLLRGRGLFYQFAEKSTAEAMEMFQKSMDLDPNFAAARWEMALACFNQYSSGWAGAGPESLERGCQLAGEAVDMDGESAEAYCVLSLGRLWSHDLDGAIEAIDRSFALDPNSALAGGVRGNLLGYAGRHDEAIDCLANAMALDPHHPTIWFHFLAHAHAQKGEFETAVPLLQQRIRRDPETDISRVLLASCFGYLGRGDEARELWRQVIEINPDYSLAQKAETLPYKNPADWQRIVDGLAKAGLPEN
jgi:adenylate cyclase